MRSKDSQLASTCQAAASHEYNPEYKSTPTGRRLKPTQRFSELMDAVISLCTSGQYGSHYLTVGHEQIAESIGVSIPTVFNYFRSKDILISALLAWAEANIESTDKPSKAAARKIIIQHISHNHEYAVTHGYTIALSRKTSSN